MVGGKQGCISNTEGSILWSGRDCELDSQALRQAALVGNGLMNGRGGRMDGLSWLSGYG